MTGRNRFFACSLLASVGLVFASVPVGATPVGLPTGDSDDLTVYVNGAYHTDDPDPEGGAAAGECSPNCTVILDVLGDPSKLGKSTALIEADGSTSDIFGVGNFSGINAYDCNASLVANACDFIAYSSDPSPSTFYLGTPSIFLPEGTGGPFDATAYLTTGEQANLWTATFFSDAEATSVPEPSSLVLFGPGLLALAGALRGKLRKLGQHLLGV
jgi:hypothetical protein